MTNNDIIDTLNDLIQLDIDAVEAYKQALKNIEDKMIYEKINDFCMDHERHIIDLSAEVRKIGGKPVERTQDVKGFLIEGFTAIRSATGTTGALKAMKMNEKLTNKKYHDALEKVLPAMTKTIVEKNYEDEKRHLAYIESVLLTAD